MKFTDMNGKQIPTADVGKIVIYGNGKIYYTDERAELKIYAIQQNRYGHDALTDTFGRKLVSVRLRQEPKRALKENLNRTDNYFLRYERKYWPEISKALYIHISEIDAQPLGDVIALENDDERSYLAAARLRFLNGADFEILHYDRIPYDPDFQIPEPDGRWSEHQIGTKDAPCYHIVDRSKAIIRKREEKFIVRCWAETISEENAETICAQAYYTKTEYSPERQRKEQIAEALNAAFGRNKFSLYDIDKLEKVLKTLELKEA